MAVVLCRVKKITATIWKRILGLIHRLKSWYINSSRGEVETNFVAVINRCILNNIMVLLICTIIPLSVTRKVDYLFNIWPRA